MLQSVQIQLLFHNKTISLFPHLLRSVNKKDGLVYL